MGQRAESITYDGAVVGTIQGGEDALNIEVRKGSSVKVSGGFSVTGNANTPRSGRFATNLITFTGVGVADETIVIAGVTYRFRADPAGEGFAAYDVDIKVSATTQATALVNAINADGTAGAYSVGTVAHPKVEAVQYDGDLVLLKAREMGSAQNSYAVTAPGTSTNFSVVATFSGGADGTAGNAGDMILVGNTIFECAKDKSWRTPNNYWFCDFINGVNLASFESDYTAAVTTDNATNMHIINSTKRLYSTNIGTQTITSPTSVEGTGLLCSLDLTNADGVEYNLEGDGTSNTPLGMQFTVCSVPSFFIKATFKCADVTGITEAHVGFRKLEAHQNTIIDYDECIALGNVGGNVKTNVTINGGAAAIQDVGDDWGDGETHSLTVIISDNGTATYLFDNAAVTSAPTTKQFDGGEVVIPFFRIVHAETTPGAIHLIDLECGPYKG